MTNPGRGNAGHSVYRRLLDRARSNREDFNLLLVRYGIERLLYRLGRSVHADRFVLKGASLFLVWSGHSYRVTRDADLLGFGTSDGDHLLDVFQAVCRAEDECADGILFLEGSLMVTPIREDQAYGGMRVTVTALLHHARIPLQVDVGYGDAVTPGPETVDYPTLLDIPAPRLRAYPRYTMVAEKLEAMVKLGMTNSRMKDFYDVWLLSRLFEFDGRTLSQAILNTFERRGTAIPEKVPLALTDEFAMDDRKLLQWKAFLRKSKPDPVEPVFAELTSAITAFLMPTLDAVANGELLAAQWTRSGAWQRDTINKGS